MLAIATRELSRRPAPAGDLERDFVFLGLVGLRIRHARGDARGLAVREAGTATVMVTAITD